MKHSLVALFLVGIVLAYQLSIPASHAPELPAEITASFFHLEPAQKSSIKKSQEDLIRMYLEEERDPQKALEILKSSSETLPPQVLELYQASIAARSLDLETARQLLGSLKLPEAALLRAAVIIGLDQREEAEKALQDIAENHPDGTTRLKAQSLLYTYQQFDVHREAPKSYLWTLLAQKLESFQEWEISLLLAEKASNENPQYRDAHIIQGVNHLHLKNYEEALNSLLKALSLDPGNSYVQYLLGVSYREQQEYEQSDEYLQYSLHSSEDYRDLANLLLAQNAEDQQLSEVAIHYYQQVLSGQGDQTFAHSRLAFLKAQHSKDYDRAEYHAKKYYDLTEGSAKSLQLLSWIYGLQGKSEEALELLSTPY